MRHSTVIIRWIASCALATVLLAGCAADTDVNYVARGGEYLSSELAAMASTVESPAFQGRPIADAAELRSDALTSLRRNDETAPLADLLTQAFPGQTRSVPYYAERAKVDGRDAWIVVEVWGSPDGTLDKSRVWAFDAETSDVIVSAVF